MTHYDLRSLSLPKLYGKALSLFVKIIENKTARSLLMPKLLKDGDMADFRDTVLHEPPMNIPVIQSDSRETQYEPVFPKQNKSKTSSPSPFISISQLASAYDKNETTPSDIAEKIITKAKKHLAHGNGYNLFISFDEQDIRKQAQESTNRIRQSKARSILEGIPIAVKDEIDQTPYPTTVGTKVFGKSPALADATVVKRLRDHGAILLGKTNMHEIGINPNGYNPHYGRAKNPYHLEHDTGGSSSGSAAAVASGICTAAIGADGGGSIRIPASFCGVFGLKPTYGRVSEHGAFPLCWSVAHIGPIATNTFDLSLLYGIISGPDTDDLNSLYQPKVTLPDKDFTLSGKTIGIFRPWFEHANPEIVRACENALSHCVQLGAQIKEIEILELNAMRQAHSIIIVSEMAAAVNKYELGLKNFGNPTRINLEIGNYFTAADYVHALRMRTRAFQIFHEIFSKVDVIITPSTAVTAPYFPSEYESRGYSDLSTVIEIMRYAFPANLIGIPAISIPVSYDKKGLPIGLQMMTRHFREDILLGFSMLLEQTLSLHTPSQYENILSV